MCDVAHPSKQGSRDMQTTIINEYITRTGRGLVANPNAEIFKEVTAQHEKKSLGQYQEGASLQLGCYCIICASCVFISIRFIVCVFWKLLTHIDHREFASTVIDKRSICLHICKLPCIHVTSLTSAIMTEWCVIIVAHMQSCMSGVIEAVASKMCGGRQFLQDAIDSKQVKVADHNNVKMYFFPKVVLAKNTELVTTREGSRQKAVADGTTSQLMSLADTMNFGFLHGAGSASSSGVAALMDGLSATAEAHKPYKYCEARFCIVEHECTMWIGYRSCQKQNRNQLHL